MNQTDNVALAAEAHRIVKERGIPYAEALALAAKPTATYSALSEAAHKVSREKAIPFSEALSKVARRCEPTAQYLMEHCLGMTRDYAMEDAAKRIRF